MFIQETPHRKPLIWYRIPNVLSHYQKHGIPATFLRPRVLLKTDNGSNFTNRYTGYLKSADPMNPRLHDFDLTCQKYNIIHYLIDPGKPAQNGKVERSHRSDQEIFYDRNTFTTLKDLKTKIKIWNDEYNNLEHCGLHGKTPNEMLQLLSMNEPTNVCG